MDYLTFDNDIILKLDATNATVVTMRGELRDEYQNASATDKNIANVIAYG